MVFHLKNKEIILRRLYEDCVYHVEEISLVEEDHLWQNVRVYVDDPVSIREFLVVGSPSFYWSGRSLSAYMTAEKSSIIHRFANILRDMQDFRIHLQTSQEAESHVKKFMKWLTGTYTVRYCRADSETFKPHCLHKERTIQLTPENIVKLQRSSSPHFIKRIETAPVYGYLNEKGKLIAMSGVGFLTKKSFAISYTETESEYRGRGIAKCLTSLASESLIKKGSVGVYSSDVTNEPSLKVAKALGFLPYKDLKCFYK